LRPSTFKNTHSSRFRASHASFASSNSFLSFFSWLDEISGLGPAQEQIPIDLLAFPLRTCVGILLMELAPLRSIPP
ncbi:MAG: hypothetical protein AAF191_16885, partial [Verrucomicrobiota bacterium]